MDTAYEHVNSEAGSEYASFGRRLVTVRYRYPGAAAKSSQKSGRRGM